MKHMGGRNYSLWDEDDGFFYDVLRYPDGRFEKFRVRSLVGIIPLYAVEHLQLGALENLSEFRTNFLWFVNNRRSLTEACCHYIEKSDEQIYELTVVNREQMRRMLDRLLDPAEFLSDYGIRSLRSTTSGTPSYSDKARCATIRRSRTTRSRAGTPIGGGPSGFRQRS